MQATQYFDHQNSPATELDLLLSSPPPAIMDQDFQSLYMMDSQQHQPSTSVTTSMSNLAFPVTVPIQDINLEIPATSFSLPTSYSPPFMASGPLFSQSPNMGYHMTDIISTTSSVSSLESTPLVADLSATRPLGESPLLDQIMQPTEYSNSAPSTGSNRGIEKKKTPSKHKRRQLSTTSLPGFSSSTHVLRWAAKKKKPPVQTPMVNVNKEPQAPLDHGTVMEALRAKLLRIQSSPSSEQESLDTPISLSSLSSSSPAESSTPLVGSKTPPPPPPPRSPPVDTQPSTGILFLDLKHKTARRKKSYSVTNDCRNHWPGPCATSPLWYLLSAIYFFYHPLLFTYHMHRIHSSLLILYITYSSLVTLLTLCILFSTFPFLFTHLLGHSFLIYAYTSS